MCGQGGLGWAHACDNGGGHRLLDDLCPDLALPSGAVLDGLELLARLGKLVATLNRRVSLGPSSYTHWLGVLRSQVREILLSTLSFCISSEGTITVSRATLRASLLLLVRGYLSFLRFWMKGSFSLFMEGAHSSWPATVVEYSLLLSLVRTILQLLNYLFSGHHGRSPKQLISSLIKKGLIGQRAT